MLDILIIATGAICVLLGFAGCLLPALPGPPLAFAGLVIAHLSERVEFSNQTLIFGLVLVVIVQVMDAVTPMLGARGWGGTRWGIWGCVLGSLAGLIFFPPFGFIAGSFLGAVVGELLGGKASGDALKAGAGAFAGFLIGTVLKLALCGLFAFWLISAMVSG